MVDVGRKHGTAGSNLIAYKFRCNVSFDSQFAAVHVFANGYILHFRSYNTLFGIIHLCTAFAFFCPIRQSDMFETQMIQRFVVTTFLAIFGCNGRKLLHITAGSNPFLSHSRQTFLQINLYRRIAERTASIVNIHRCIRSNHLFSVFDSDSRSQVDLLHTYTYERIHCSLHVGFLCMSICFFIFFHKLWFAK